MKKRILFNLKIVSFYLENAPFLGVEGLHASCSYISAQSDKIYTHRIYENGV